LKLSLIIRLLSVFMYTPSVLIDSVVHFMLQGLWRKLDEAPIHIASLLSLLTFKPEHLVNRSKILKTI
jgi:hypothetical protein